MTASETRLAEDRALRDSAKAVFEARMDQVRRSLGEKSISERATDEAKARAVKVAEEGAAVAQESKWVIAATGLAIMAWLMRRPLINSARKAYDRLFGTEPASPWARLRDWTKTRS
ncbi:MAG TPA: hypothetical protein VFP14_10050 [Novosphingobium sp.]|nr:hypothetical protein [Novosphingobium sp.]